MNTPMRIMSLNRDATVIYTPVKIFSFDYFGCSYCFLYFYDWPFTFNLVFSDTCVKNVKSRPGTG